MNLKSMFLFSCCAFSSGAININNTVWNSNWNVMYFWQTGNQVSSEYMYDDGIITGALSGDTLRGWWREYNNVKECGPGNEWCGPVVLLFSADGKSFTGSWGYCATSPASLDPNGSGWTGTLKEGVTSYTQQECENAGRYWCNGTCSINPCNQQITKELCEASGRFWCTDSCWMTSCNETRVAHPAASKPLTPAILTHATRSRYIDIRGRRAEAAGIGVFLERDKAGKISAGVYMPLH